MNWKVRIKQPAWWIGMVAVVMSPILAYMGLAYSDLTTWDSIGGVFTQFVTNPYLIGTVVVAVLGAIGVNTDPTTVGLGDSEQAMTYEEPKSNRE